MGEEGDGGCGQGDDGDCVHNAAGPQTKGRANAHVRKRGEALLIYMLYMLSDTSNEEVRVSLATAER